MPISEGYHDLYHWYAQQFLFTQSDTKISTNYTFENELFVGCIDKLMKAVWICTDANTSQYRFYFPETFLKPDNLRLTLCGYAFQEMIILLNIAKKQSGANWIHENYEELVLVLYSYLTSDFCTDSFNFFDERLSTFFGFGLNTVKVVLFRFLEILITNTKANTDQIVLIGVDRCFEIFDTSQYLIDIMYIYLYESSKTLKRSKTRTLTLLKQDKQLCTIGKNGRPVCIKDYLISK